MPRGSGFVFLCGFMGVGKSTVGKLLAQQLSGAFVDLDNVVEQTHKKSVAEIFATEGEEAFRRYEKQALQQTTKDANIDERKVIALGGGTLKDAENIQFILSTGTLVFLSAAVSTLTTRLRDTGLTRPLLAGLSSQEQEEKISALLLERKPLYEKAHVEVKTDGKSPEEVAKEIHMGLKEKAS